MKWQFHGDTKAPKLGIYFVMQMPIVTVWSDAPFGVTMQPWPFLAHAWQPSAAFGPPLLAPGLGINVM